MRINKKTLGPFLLLIFVLAAPLLASDQDYYRDCHDIDLEEKRLEKVMNYLIEKAGSDLISEKNNFRLTVYETPLFMAGVEFVEERELLPDYSSGKAKHLFIISINHRFIDVLTPEEQISVIAHEIGHIASGYFSVSPFRKMITLLVRVISLNKLGNFDFDEGKILKADIRADKFAVSLLKRCDIDPQALLTALDKFCGGQIPLKREKSLKKHILKQKNFSGQKDRILLSF